MVTEQDSSHPTGVVGDADKDGKDVFRARNRKANAALRMKTLGADWDEIAESLGFPTPRAALVATEQALEKELRAEDKAILRKMVDRRIERLIRAAMSKAINEDSPEQLPAIGKVRELIADQRKLWGLDAPTEVAFYSPAEGEIEQWVATHVVRDIPALEEGDIFESDIVEGEVTEEAS